MKTYVTLKELAKNVNNIANSIRAFKGISECNLNSVEKVIESMNFIKFYININKQDGEVFISLICKEKEDWLSLSIEFIMKDTYNCTVL